MASVHTLFGDNTMTTEPQRPNPHFIRGNSMNMFIIIQFKVAKLLKNFLEKPPAKGRSR